VDAARGGQGTRYCRLCFGTIRQVMNVNHRPKQQQQQEGNGKGMFMYLIPRFESHPLLKKRSLGSGALGRS